VPLPKTRARLTTARISAGIIINHLNGDDISLEFKTTFRYAIAPLIHLSSGIFSASTSGRRDLINGIVSKQFVAITLLLRLTNPRARAAFQAIRWSDSNSLLAAQPYMEMIWYHHRSPGC
jgi:hypothetical protein